MISVYSDEYEYLLMWYNILFTDLLTTKDS